MIETEMIYDEIQNSDHSLEASDRDSSSLSLGEGGKDSFDSDLTHPIAEEDPAEAEGNSPMDQSSLEREEEITRLQNEIASLREALAKKEREEAILGELEEFRRLFPKASVGALPSEVQASVDGGIPLSAAYALYEKKRAMAELHAKQINEENAVRSAGKAGKGTAGEYFSPEEVRAMSQKQVREHYAQIRESMKSWH